MAEKRISAREAGVTCKTCKFFDPLNPDAKNGKCRNFPPQVHVMRSEAGEDMFRTAWPEVNVTEFCGAWNPIPTVGPAGGGLAIAQAMPPGGQAASLSSTGCRSPSVA